MAEGCEEVESATILQKKASALKRACCIPKIVKLPELAGSREHTTLRRLDYVCQQQLQPPPPLELGRGRGTDVGTPSLAKEHWAMLVGTESTPAAAPIATVKQLDEDSGIALPPLSTFCTSERAMRDRIT